MKYGTFTTMDAPTKKIDEAIDNPKDDLTDDELDLIDKKETWITRANEIEEKYNKKFEKYL